METTITAAEKSLVDELMAFPDVYERLTYLVDISPSKPVPEAHRKDCYMVQGCMAQLHIVPFQESGHWTFTPFSEAPMVMALAGLYCRIFSGHTGTDILAHEPQVLEQTDLCRQLSPNRRAGAANIAARIKGYIDETTNPQDQQ